MQIKYILALIFGATLFFSLVCQVTSLSCGKVWAGPERGEDRTEQKSKTRLQANWEGFQSSGGSGRGSVRYTIAAITDKIATKEIRESGPQAPDNKRCRANPGFTANADLVDFQFGNVGTNTSVKIIRQPLRRDEKYYVIVRANQGRSVIYSNTNGIRVVKDDDDDLEPYEQGLIAMGAAICCLLLLALLLLLLLLVARGRGEDKYTTTVHRNENVDKL
jgi:hypothetical protein